MEIGEFDTTVSISLLGSFMIAAIHVLLAVKRIIRDLNLEGKCSLPTHLCTYFSNIRVSSAVLKSITVNQSKIFHVRHAYLNHHVAEQEKSLLLVR